MKIQLDQYNFIELDQDAETYRVSGSYAVELCADNDYNDVIEMLETQGYIVKCFYCQERWVLRNVDSLYAESCSECQTN